MVKVNVMLEPGVREYGRFGEIVTSVKPGVVTEIEFIE
jgi:hypothetical protein